MGRCGDGKAEETSPSHILRSRGLPSKGGMWGRENDYEVVNQRQLFLKTLILTDNFLIFVRFRKL